jgi:pyruvate-ferredoxin/flavodoxin oxidoreductase
VLVVDDAVAALELRICDARVRRLGASPSAAEHAQHDIPARGARNAFGRIPRELVGASAAETVRLAMGATLGGLRTSVSLLGDELVETAADLAVAAQRLLPLVVQVTSGEAGRSGLHAVTESGCFVLVARDGQEALDLTLLARWLAERALCPGVVVHDGPIVERLSWPDDEALAGAIGAADAPIVCPTEAQRLLFGETRPCLLPWFDADHPVATGGPRSAAARSRLEEPRRLLFGESVRSLACEGAQAISRITGRPLEPVDVHGLADAEVVIVAQGRPAGVACAVADALRRAGSARVGVVAPSWLRPFPAAEIAEHLRDRTRVIVVEPISPSVDGAPLLADVGRALGDARGLVAARCASVGPDPVALAGLCEELKSGRADPTAVRLEAPAVTPETGFPRRDALLQAAIHAYPALGETPPASEIARAALTAGAPAARSIGVLAEASTRPADRVARFAAKVGDASGPWLRGSIRERWPGIVEARLHVAPDPFADPGPRAPVPLLVVLDVPPREAREALDGVAPGGRVLLASDDSDERLATALPGAWRRALRERSLRLLAGPADPDAALDAAWACLEADSDTEADGRIRAIAWERAAVPDAASPSPPAPVSRIPRARPAHDSLPRFFGELLEPLEAGAPHAGDPLDIVGAVPGDASALAPEPCHAPLPELDAAKCSGCGRCWSACPDSAIGATALPAEAVLTAASRIAGTEGRIADAVRRTHKHLASRLVTDLAREGGGVIDSGRCREAFEALAGRLEIADDERAEHDRVVAATGEVVDALRPMATAELFVEREEEAKGSGAILVLAFDPRACVGCGLCAAVCPESAIAMRERGSVRRGQEKRRFAAWEALPDTPADWLASLAGKPVPGRPGALLLSRHFASAQVGAGSGEPGSGERLALRLVTAIAEAEGQSRLGELARRVADARTALETSARERVGEGIAQADVHALRDALEQGGAHPDWSAIAAGLEARGARVEVHRPAVLRMLGLVEALQASERLLTGGPDGLGRARFGVVLAGERLSAALARFPLHPHRAPLVASAPAAAADIARGAAAGMVAAHVALVCAVRAATVEVEDPPDRAERLDAIAALGWSDLTPDERAGCPPLLLVLDDATWLDHGMELLARTFASDLPIKLILLDGRGRLETVTEPALLALLQRRGFVLSSSIAHADHLAAGVADALAFAGPALVQIHAPSPERHGFASDRTLEIARLAVEARAHFLLRYDPAGEGHFGERIDLAGNPNLEGDTGEIDFAGWAARQQRFAPEFEGNVPGPRLAAADRRQLDVWRTLQALAGVRSPFVTRLREALSAELEADFAARTRALEAEHRAALARAREAVEDELIERVTARLQVLSAGGTDALGAFSQDAPRTGTDETCSDGGES